MRGIDRTLVTGIPMTQENDFSRKAALLDLRDNYNYVFRRGFAPLRDSKARWLKSLP